MAEQRIDLVSAVSAVWNISTVGNADDAISDPASGDGLYIRQKGSAAQAQQYNCTNPSTAGTMTSVTIRWLGRVDDPDFRSLLTLVRIRLNGTWYSSSAMTLQMAETFTWYSATIAVSGELNGSAPIIELTGDGIDGSNSDLKIDAVYGVITYTPTITEQYAISSGNYSNDAIWSTGVKPTTGTVYSNGYNVTVDVDSSATVVTNVAGTVAVAGGVFLLADGVTLTANVYAGESTCLTAGTGVGGAIIGSIWGGSAANAYGFQKIGSVVKTVTITGDSHGGSGTGANGILNSSNGPINQTGNVYGGSSLLAFGHRNSGTATDIITGNSYAGDAAEGALNASSGNITVTGYSYAVGSVAGSANASSGTLTVEQNAIGGTSSAAYGTRNYGSGIVAVAGAAVSADSPGLGAGVANTGAGYATVGSMVTGTSGVSPCIGHVHVADLSAFTALVRSSSSSVTLSSEVGLPSPFEPSPVFGGA